MTSPLVSQDVVEEVEVADEPEPVKAVVDKTVKENPKNDKEVKKDEQNKKNLDKGNSNNRQTDIMSFFKK